MRRSEARKLVRSAKRPMGKPAHADPVNLTDVEVDDLLQALGVKVEEDKPELPQSLRVVVLDRISSAHYNGKVRIEANPDHDWNLLVTGKIALVEELVKLYNSREERFTPWMFDQPPQFAGEYLTINENNELGVTSYRRGGETNTLAWHLGRSGAYVLGWAGPIQRPNYHHVDGKTRVSPSAT